MHAKTAVIDGVFSTVGSSNLDWLSFVANNELNVIVLGDDFAATHQLEGFTAIVGLARHAQVHVLGEKLAQPRSHDGVVVHDSDSDHEGLGCLFGGMRKI